MLTTEQINFFKEQGYLIIENLLTPEEITQYRNLYEDFLNNKINAAAYRSDLGGHAGDGTEKKTENITQIMVPSVLLPELLDQPLHKKTVSLAREIYGDDMEIDFDMLIDKAPFTNTPTPWHQDCAYWIKMPDTRAISFWVALDDTFKDNGCMWYVPGSHLQSVRQHHMAGSGGNALECEGSEEEGIAAEIPAGACVLHHGGTLHYSRGNSTPFRRRAFITNARPDSMIRFEKENGYSHSGDKK